MKVNPRLIKTWMVAKDQLDKIKAHELEIRKEIAEHILDGKIKGAKKGSIGKYNLTATGKLNYVVDAEFLENIWSELTPQEKEAIKYKPSIVASKYKTLDAKSKLNKAITSKSGTPSLKLDSMEG